MHPSDHPVGALTVMTASAVGSTIVGSARERDGERRGYQSGVTDGVEQGRRLGRAAAMLEMSARIKKLTAAKPRPSRRRFLPRGDREPGGR